jgi:phage-related protein
MTQNAKLLAWLHGEVRTPPFSRQARIEAGVLLRRLQSGESLGLPHSRPMPVIGPHVHELRIPDETKTWRIFYAVTTDVIVILEVMEKKTPRTPKHVLAICQQRLKRFQAAERRPSS